jgi:hypothetical protein
MNKMIISTYFVIVTLVVTILTTTTTTIHATEITKSLRRHGMHHNRRIRDQQQQQVLDPPKVKTIWKKVRKGVKGAKNEKDTFKHRLEKVVPGNSKEYWNLRMLPEQKQNAEDPVAAVKYAKEEADKIKHIKSEDDIAQWKKRLQTAEVQELIDNRMREQQFRAMDNIREPIIPGIENIGVSVNMFDMELKERVVVLNRRWVKDSSSSLYARKYRVPGVLNIIEKQNMEDDVRTKIYQTPSEFAEEQTLNYGIKDVLGGYQLNKKMTDIRNLLAEGDYMLEKSRHVNLYSVGLRSEYDHLIKGNKEASIINGEMVDLPNVPEEILNQEHVDDYHKLTYINDDFLHAICPVTTKLTKEKEWLPDCILSEKYLMLDRDLGNGMNINGFFSGRAATEKKNEMEEIPLCKANDMEKIFAFFHEFGTHVVTGVDVGGKITQSFHISHADVDLVEEDLGPEIAVQNIVNKYQEIIGAHDTSKKHGKIDNVDVGSDVVDDLSSSDDNFVKDILGASTTLANNIEDNDLEAAKAAIQSETAKRKVTKSKQSGRRRRLLNEVTEGKEDDAEEDEGEDHDEKKERAAKEAKEFHDTDEMKFRGEKVSNNGFVGDHDEILHNKLRDIGILKISMDYKGGIQYPFGVKNIDADDYSAWIDTIRKSPTAIKSQTRPLYQMLVHADIYQYCTIGMMKREEEDKIIHKKLKKGNVEKGDATKLTDEEKDVVNENLKERRKYSAKIKTAGSLPDRPIYSSLAKHAYGRKLLRKITLLRDAMNYLRFKVHLIGQKDQKRASYRSSALREFGRQEQMIWNFEKNVIKLDAEGPEGALPVITESSIWGRLKQLMESTEESSKVHSILTPTFRFQNHRKRYMHLVEKLCEAETETYERTLRAVKGMGQTAKARLKDVVKTLNNQTDGLKVETESDFLPTYEMVDATMQSNVAAKSKMCLAQWRNKADTIMTNSFGAAKASTAVLKKVFVSNLDANCDVCVRVVNNELDPDREYGTYDFGMSSATKFCESFPSKMKQTRCLFIWGVITRSVIQIANLRPYEAISPTNLLSTILKVLMSNSPEFAIYSQKINIMTGKPWRKFEVALEICKRAMATCDRYLNFDDFASESSGAGKQLDDKGEDPSSAKVAKEKEAGSKDTKGLLDELSKSKDVFNPKKAKSLAAKVVKEESTTTCGKYDELKSKYLEIKKHTKRSKMNKICYACSKFITSLNLQVNLPAPIPSKSYIGKNILNKFTVSSGKPNLYADMKRGGKQYADVTNAVCDAKMFISDKSSLDEAESKCGGSPLQLVTGNGKSTSFLEEEETPLSQALTIQSAGTSNPDATKALNGVKQELKRVKNGKADCGGETFASSSITEMESRLTCIEKDMDGMAEAGLSQASCKLTLKTVEDRLNDKLRVLASSQGFPVPATLPLPRRLAMYNHLLSVAESTNFQNVDKAVIGKTKLSSSDDFCVAIDMCDEKQSKKLEKYWSTQLYRGQNYGHIEKEGTPVMPPGFVGKNGGDKKGGDAKASSSSSSNPKELVTVEEGLEKTF